MDEFVEVLPASQRTGDEWYAGTADAVYQNLDIIRTHKPEFVLVLSGDHIYKMDYGPTLAYHVANEADMTVSCQEVPIAEAAGEFGVLTVNDESRVLRFDEKPAQPTSTPGNDKLTLVSMGNDIFNTQFLDEQLIADADNLASKHDFGKDIIPSIIDKHRVFAYPFRDPETNQQAFWRDVGTLDAYWEAHDSMVSGGCVIPGSRVKRSMLFSDVVMHSYATVTDSVLLPEVDVGRHCRIHKAIIDRGCRLPENMVIGEDHEQDKARGFRVTDKGIVLVTPDMLGQSLHTVR